MSEDPGRRSFDPVPSTRSPAGIPVSAPLPPVAEAAALAVGVSRRPSLRRCSAWTHPSWPSRATTGRDLSSCPAVTLTAARIGGVAPALGPEADVEQLDSSTADLTGMGGPHAGSITAGLFEAEFVGTSPWAHVDVASTAQQPTLRSRRDSGASGFGAKLLIQIATDFRAP